MKTSFQKVKLNRKTSAKSNVSQEKAPQRQDKTDVLIELRAKIERQREVMRQSGKRFSKGNVNATSAKNIQTAGSLKHVEKTENSGFIKKQSKAVQVSVGSDEAPMKEEVKVVDRQTVDLTSLMIEKQDTSMSSSRLFEKQLVKQKDRNKEVVDFMSRLQLSQFSEGLINLGYDELDVLMEVSCEELNFLMMRASQQRVLTEALKQYRARNDLPEESAMTSSFAKTSSHFHVKVKNEAAPIKRQKLSFEITRPKSAMTVASTIPTNNSGLFGSSFFADIGGQQWSMDSLVRRACSSCFKVLPGTELTQEEGSYYCLECKNKEEDPLSITMNSSMVRDYKI